MSGSVELHILLHQYLGLVFPGIMELGVSSLPYLYLLNVDTYFRYLYLRDQPVCTWLTLCPTCYLSLYCYLNQLYQLYQHHILASEGQPVSDRKHQGTDSAREDRVEVQRLKAFINTHLEDLQNNRKCVFSAALHCTPLMLRRPRTILVRSDYQFRIAGAQRFLDSRSTAIY